MITLGFIAILVGGIWLLVAAFQESVLWGLALFFFPGIVSIAFLILHPERAWRPFMLQIVGVVMFFVGVALAHH